MKTNFILFILPIFILLLLFVNVQGDYKKSSAFHDWSLDQLNQWLADHHIPHPYETDKEKAQRVVKEYYQDVYSTWSDSDLRDFLRKHGVIADDRSTTEQLRDQAYDAWLKTKKIIIGDSTDSNSQQNVFNDIKDSVFETWDESTLREFLVSHGIVAPKGPKEQLVKAAKDYYTSASSAAAAATSSFVDQVNKAKGQVYDTWTETQLRLWLQERGFIPPPRSKPQQLIELVRMHWYSAEDTASSAASSVASSVTDTPSYIWEKWSDSQLRDWLVYHRLLESKATLKRKELLEKVKQNWNTATQSAASILPEYTPHVSFFDRKPTLVENVTTYVTWLLATGKSMTPRDIYELRSYVQKQVMSNTPSVETLSNKEWWNELGKKIEDNSNDLRDATKDTTKNAGEHIKKNYKTWIKTKDKLVSDATEYIDRILPDHKEDYTVSAVLSGIRDKLSDGSEYAKEKLEKILDVIRGGESSATSAGHKATKAAKSAYSAGKEEL